jgi:hypothetical protein
MARHTEPQCQLAEKRGCKIIPKTHVVAVGYQICDALLAALVLFGQTG